ncbi:hypothetical protein PVK06_012956 [Gossypium arboreum]|uniref:Uncharacterized protein n=1 Tax=Gossypium arboreum TaxID=29729 RepID=A0ABR0QCW0_GOSAR|nr:hypothetical protein PVK06_012956 [Gossypium arboreum]
MKSHTMVEPSEDNGDNASVEISRRHVVHSTSLCGEARRLARFKFGGFSIHSTRSVAYIVDPLYYISFFFALIHDAHTTCDVWNITTQLFEAVTSAKLSRICHDLHSLKKCTLSLFEYVAKIQNICALIETFGSQISESEKVKVVLAALPPEFDIVLTLASFSIETLLFQRLVDVLLEYETRLAGVVQELPL